MDDTEERAIDDAAAPRSQRRAHPGSESSRTSEREEGALRHSTHGRAGGTPTKKPEREAVRPKANEEEEEGAAPCETSGKASKR